MAHLGRRRLLSSILLTFVCITSFVHDVIGKQTWTVGDSFGWNRSPPFSYDQWAAGKAIKVGDALLFSFTAGQHDVLEVTESNLANCVTSNPISSSGSDPTVIQLTTAGYQGFISGFPGDCTNGMHLSLQVISSSGPGETPSSSPPVSGPGPGTRVSPPHVGSLSPAGAPLNSAGAPGLSPSSAPSRAPSAIPPGLPPGVRPPVDIPAGIPPAGYAPGAAPNIPNGSPLSNAPNSLPAPKLAPMAIVPSGPLESTSAPGSSPARAPAGHVAAPPARFSSPSEFPGSSPSPTPITGISPLNDLTPPESSPLASPPGSSVGAPFGPKTSAGTSRHRLDLAGLVIMMLPALIFSPFLQHLYSICKFLY